MGVEASGMHGLDEGHMGDRNATYKISFLHEYISRIKKSSTSYFQQKHKKIIWKHKQSELAKHFQTK
jgi:hypothetical protein